MLRRLIPTVFLALLALGVTAQAQRPFVVPNYYVSQLPVLASGVPFQGELTEADGQSYKDGARVDLLQFEGLAGGQVRVDLSSDDFDTYLSVFGPSGELIDSNDDADWDYSATYRSSLDLYLYEDGRYTVVVSSYSQYGLGAYEVLLTTSTPFAPQDAESVTVPGSVEGTLNAGDPVVPDGWTGPSKAYSFSVADDTALKIDARSYDFDTYLYLFDESGRMVASNDDLDYSEASGYATDSQLFLVLGPGEYVVYVSTWAADGAGDFTLTFQEYVPR